MFEENTAEKTLQNLLDSVPDTVDKRPGSIIYDTLAPQSFLIAKFYQDLSFAIDNVIFLDTAKGEFLDKKGFEFGITRRSATATERKATFAGATITNGTRFFTNDGLNWTFENGNVTCDIKGYEGNSTAVGSQLIPIVDIQGLTTSIIGDVIVPGNLEESNDSYKNRILLKIREPEINSNKAQIKKWCMDVVGTGDARVFPLWNGANTVKSIIINTEKEPASDSIISQIQRYIDPDSKGLGEGVADIGVIFTAEKAKEIKTNVSFKIISKASGKSDDDIKKEVEEALKSYLKLVAFQHETTKDIVRFQEISALILNTPSVIDFSDLIVNGATSNIEIDLDSVATAGTITLN